MHKASKIRNVADKADIENGGETILRCAGCKKPLARLWVTRPSAKFNWKVKATCPYCNGESPIEHIQGMFHQAAYSEMINESTLEDRGELYIENFVEEKDVVKLIVKRY